MKGIGWLFLLSGLCCMQPTAAQVPPAEPGDKSPGHVISVELRGDTMVYRSVPGCARFVTDGNGRRYRLRPILESSLPVHALSLELGAYPACGSRDVFPGEGCYDASYFNFPGSFPGERRYYSSPLRSSGAWGIVYGYRVRRWLETGVSLSYAGFYQNLLRASDGKIAWRLREHYVTVMPFARFSWLNRRYVRLYSSLHLGYQWSYQQYYWMDYYNQSYLAAHFTPLGISVGRRLFGYAEFGFGTRGVFVGGIGYRFGNAEK